MEKILSKELEVPPEFLESKKKSSKKASKKKSSFDQREEEEQKKNFLKNYETDSHEKYLAKFCKEALCKLFEILRIQVVQKPMINVKNPYPILHKIIKEQLKGRYQKNPNPMVHFPKYLAPYYGLSESMLQQILKHGQSIKYVNLENETDEGFE